MYLFICCCIYSLWYGRANWVLHCFIGMSGQVQCAFLIYKIDTRWITSFEVTQNGLENINPMQWIYNSIKKNLIGHSYDRISYLSFIQPRKSTRIQTTIISCANIYETTSHFLLLEHHLFAAWINPSLWHHKHRISSVAHIPAPSILGDDNTFVSFQ